MTLQNPRITKIIILFVIISVPVIFFSLGALNSCGIRHIALLDNIKTFEKNQDPEFCENTVNDIISFNEQCEPEIEILDCG